VAAQSRPAAAGTKLKSALLRDRLKLPPGLRPLTPDEALLLRQDIDNTRWDTRAAHELLRRFCLLASEDDGALLAYTVSEVSRWFGWPDCVTIEAAEVAGEAGYIERQDDLLILRGPRVRPAMGATPDCSRGQPSPPPTPLPGTSRNAY